MRAGSTGHKIWLEPRNRAAADIVATGEFGKGRALRPPLAGLFLLVRRENRLAAKFDALFLR